MRQLVVPRSMGAVLFGCIVAMGTARPAGAVELSLEESVRMALVHNVDVERARNELRSAGVDASRTMAEFFPNVLLDGSWSTSEIPRPVPGTFDSLTANQQFSDKFFSGSATSRVLLFDGLGNIARHQSSSRTESAFEERLLDTRQDVALEAERRFFEVHKQNALLEVRNEAAELSKGQLDKTTAMKDLGAATLADVYKADVEFSNDQLEILRTERDLEVAKSRLGTYLGLDPREAIELEEEDLTLDETFDVMEAAVRALEVNPGLNAARLQLEADHKGVSAAKAQRWPAFSLFGTVNFQNDKLQDFTEDEKTNWVYGVSMNFTVFDGLRITSNIRKAQYTALTSERALENTERDVLFILRQAHLDLQIVKEAIRVLERTVASSEEDLRLAQERYNIGEGTILDVISAQVNLSQARSDLVSARYDARVAVSVMKNAIGDVELPEVEERG